ncbi:MAG TPA: hypothetical protein VGQ83_18380 [Polyangia bacterium]|jgi:hypothetical protein
MEFYAGNPDQIGRAFTAYELGGLRDGSLAHAYADLSLHLSPDHLDLFSEEIARSTGREAVLLLDCLERQVGGTDGESSADVVSQSWVEMVAAAPDGSIQAITQGWIAAVTGEVDEPSAEDSPDAARAVAALVGLCREALRLGTRVVFAWYL